MKKAIPFIDLDADLDLIAEAAKVKTLPKPYQDNLEWNACLEETLGSDCNSYYDTYEEFDVSCTKEGLGEEEEGNESSSNN